MAAVYIDTSALGRVLLGEPGAQAIEEALSEYDEHVSSRVLRLELRRLGLRNDLVDFADRLIADVALLPLDESRLRAAETIPPADVASLDSLHLAAAVELAEADLLDTVMTHDKRLADGARHHGLTVLAPA